MGIARVFTAAFACVALGAMAAACSGSFGQGTGLPQPLGSPGAGAPATPTPPANSSSSILTYGESTAFQNLPEVGGYSGAIALPAPGPSASATAAPAKGKRGKGNASPEAAPTPLSIAIGATLSTVKPEDGPDLNFQSGKGRKRRTREHPARALVYVKLLPTHDITLESYPRIAIDVPREIASQYRDGEFGLALWNAGEKESKYRLAVAERDTATPPPLPQQSAAARPSPTPRPSPSTSATPLPGTSPGARSSNAPGSGGLLGGPGAAPQPSTTLPPERLVFAGTATPLRLVANRPLIFALYALPHPSTPAPKPSSAASAAPAGGSTAPGPASPAPKAS